MKKFIKPGRIIYATGIAALGILCFISKDFIVGRPPEWPSKFTVNPALAYISGTALIIAAIAIIFKKKAGSAALLIAGLIFFLSVPRHLSQFMDDWLNANKSLALFGGSLIIASSFFEEDENVNIEFSNSKNWNKNFIALGCFLLFIFFIASGYAHFKFSKFVNVFIPEYIPFHSLFAYFCGICLVAGGAGLLIPATRKWAALLAGIMIAGWFILLHIPRFFANTDNVSDRMGLFESLTFAGILFVLAGMFAEKK
jgi:uncharacterized membrane protein